MVNEELRLIIEAEQKAKKKIEEAQRELATLLESARREAEKIKEKQGAETQLKVKKLLEEYRKKAETDAQKIISGAQQKKLEMEREAENLISEAVKLIFDAVLGRTHV
ncbi:MAG: hypothetical protein ACP5PX_03595 [Candidatus Hadarchaeum sp.]|uniref:hypothetical protein n=1 Tax=Candidatus Hadarchaeum sp. TaxID=2883567 RepID=UPI003D12053A